MRRVLVSGLLVCVGLFVAGCGGGSPTAPSTPTYPSVAGNYSGTMTFTFPSLGTRVDCPATTSITQSGATVTIGAITPSGSCASLGASPPLGSLTIDVSGSLGTQTVSNFSEPSCNGTYNATLSGGFSGSTLQFSFVYTAVSGGCLTNPGNFTLSATLTKH